MSVPLIGSKHTPIHFYADNGNQVSLYVYNQNGLDLITLVDPDGMPSFPMGNMMKVAHEVSLMLGNMTQEEVVATIRKRLNREVQ